MDDKMADMEQRLRWAQEKRNQYRKLKEKGYVRITINLSPETISVLDQYCSSTGASRTSAIDAIVRNNAARIAANKTDKEADHVQHTRH